MWNWVEKVNELQKSSTPFLIATIIKSTGSTPRDIGTKMIVLEDESFFGTIGGGKIEQLVLEDAKNIFSSKDESKVIEYPLTKIEGHLCGGHVSVFFELSGKAPQIYLFGAGHVGQAFCQTMKDTPFQVHLIDDREEWVFSKELPGSTIKHHTKFEDFIETAPFSDKDTYIIIMTPSHKYDREILELVIKKPSKFLGMIGSKRKWAEVQKAMLGEGFSQSELDRVVCPVGIIKAGKTPKEISICIATQIIQKQYESN